MGQLTKMLACQGRACMCTQTYTHCLCSLWMIILQRSPAYHMSELVPFDCLQLVCSMHMIMLSEQLAHLDR